MAEYKSAYTGPQIDSAIGAVAGKQDTLVSGTNIKTINDNSILGSGNLTISASYTPPVYTPTDIDIETNVIDFSSTDYAEIFTDEPPIFELTLGDQLIQMQKAIVDNDAGTIQYQGIVSSTDVSQVLWMQLENDSGSYSGSVYFVDIASGGGGGSGRANYEFEALSFDMANNEMYISNTDLAYIKQNYPATLTVNIPQSTMYMNFVLTMPTGSGQDDFTYAMTIPMGSAAIFSVGFMIEPRTTEEDAIEFTIAQIGSN